MKAILSSLKEFVLSSANLKFNNAIIKAIEGIEKSPPIDCADKKVIDLIKLLYQSFELQRTDKDIPILYLAEIPEIYRYITKILDALVNLFVAELKTKSLMDIYLIFAEEYGENTADTNIDQRTEFETELQNMSEEKRNEISSFITFFLVNKKRLQLIHPKSALDENFKK